MSHQTWQFEALDTLFFRESRPMESMGNSELSSLFPPSVRTLTGAVRTTVGEIKGVNWSEFQEDSPHPLKDIIGYGDDLGPLSFSGVWITHKKQRIYPAPLNLLQKILADDKKQLFRLEIDNNTVCCDLGKKVRLPMIPKNSDAEGSNPLSDTWLTAEQYEKVLQGELPDTDTLIDKKEHLLAEEPRIGIARDNRCRIVKKGLLYQTRHIRLKQDVRLEVDIQGLESDIEFKEYNLTRLGGEGRLASISKVTQSPELKMPDVDEGMQGIIIHLLTPMASSESESDEPLPGFKKVKDETDQTIWQGEINKISLVLHTAITGKVLREGGWDMQERAPRAVKSYVPAGSVFYCTFANQMTLDEQQQAIKRLHNSQIGKEKELGRGKIAIGLWI